MAEEKIPFTQESEATPLTPEEIAAKERAEAKAALVQTVAHFNQIKTDLDKAVSRGEKADAIGIGFPNRSVSFISLCDGINLSSIVSSLKSEIDKEIAIFQAQADAINAV